MIIVIAKQRNKLYMWRLNWIHWLKQDFKQRNCCVFDETWSVNNNNSNIPRKEGSTCSWMPQRSWQPTRSGDPFSIYTFDLKPAQKINLAPSGQILLERNTGKAKSNPENSQTEQWWHRGGLNWLHFRQKRTLCWSSWHTWLEAGPWSIVSDPTSESASPSSSSITGLQLGGMPPGSVRTTAK